MLGSAIVVAGEFKEKGRVGGGMGAADAVGGGGRVSFPS